MVTAQQTPQSAETEKYNVIGTRPIRHDGVDKVTGAAQYGADIALPGMLAGRVLRSPHAHARIVSIDTSKAEALDGVLAVITNADFPRASDEVIDTGEGTAQLNWVLDNVIASDKVLYKGHAVAAVAATDHHIAEDAIELIEVEYEVLTPVLDVRDAMVDGSPLLHESLHTGEMDGSKSDNASNTASHLQFTKGELDAGFAEADVVIEREFETSMAHQGYIEPHNGTAYYRADGTLDIYTSTQGAFVVRDSVAPLLQLSPSQVKVTPMEIGGGFRRQDSDLPGAAGGPALAEDRASGQADDEPRGSAVGDGSDVGHVHAGANGRQARRHDYSGGCASRLRGGGVPRLAGGCGRDVRAGSV